ncbi:MAG: hypothetical protein HC897_00230 [Thermoanaerobaculia bacterium]|nr:hypothetical protein [Thermoanaerobaculia bacterium]
MQGRLRGLPGRSRRAAPELALRVAEDVLSLGETRLLEPMNPADRRVVHMALAESEGVETESEGEGYYKRIKIMPVL